MLIAEMKKILINVFFTAFVWVICGAGFVSAQVPVKYYDWSSTLKTGSTRVLGATTTATSSATSSKDFSRFNKYLIGKELNPNNPFYFIKRLQENVQLAFTFNAKAKEEMRVQLAGQRLVEMQKMADQVDVKAITTAAENYQSAMEDVAKNIGDSVKNVDAETAKQTIALHEVMVKVPSQGEEAVQQAIEASEKSADTVADLTDRPAIPPDLVDRITALKAQGLLTPEEAAKLISLKTRTEARQELRKYVNEGILPTSDFLRMNEQMKASFPDEFYKIHEVERFMEMKKMESQRPDPAIQNKIQEFAKSYKSGDIVPADIRSYWGPMIRLEEIQNTIRPDLIDPTLFKNNSDDEKKYKEMVERYKPRQEDLDFVNKYMTQNKTNVDQLPPEYQRMYRLGQTYGTQTATIPSDSKQSTMISCPSNAHFVSVPSDPNGGYCIPNYTPRYDDQQNYGYQDTPCPGGYHRNYAGGGCMQDYNQNNNGYLPTLTATPGNYPSPYYSSTTTQCGSNSHWVPEPINPRGGYCAGDNYQQPTSSSNSSPGRESQEAACKAGGGTCVSWVNNACGCVRPSDSNTGCKMPQNGCGGNGRWWDLSSCACREQGSYPSACTYPSAGCPAGRYWDSGSCACRSNSEASGQTNTTTTNTTNTNNAYTPPTSSSNREMMDSNCRRGGGTCNWNGDTCQCINNSSSSNYTPPSGYGSCSQGQYWNGSSCVNNQVPSSNTSPSRESQEAACRSGGGTCISWVNDACGCERPGNTNTQTAPTPQPQQPTQQPEQNSQPTQPAQQPTSPPQPETQQSPPATP